MQKIITYTTERALEDANQYIMDNDISDEDEKQNLYLAALEFCNARNNGYKYSFSKFVDRPSTKKMMDEFTVDAQEEQRVPIEAIFYDSEYRDVNAADKILYCINQLTDREEKILYERFVNQKTLREVGNIYNVTGDRIHQIEAKALRKLRHPSRSKLISYMLDYDNISFDDFDEKFALMIDGKYEPTYKRPNYHAKSELSNISEKIVIYTKAELEAKKKQQEKEAKINKLLKDVKNIKKSERVKFLYQPDNDFDVICKTIDKLNDPYIARLSYLGIMYNKKFFNLRIGCQEFGLEAHMEDNELVITGDSRINAMLQFPLYSEGIEVIINYIINNYDNFDKFKEENNERKE